jgi:hypothetical protein
MFLLIENQGEAPVEAYTLLGYGSTRNCGVEGTIGQFGSGAQHAINVCLRHNLPVWVYCGNTRLEFALEKELIQDGTVDKDGEPTETEVQHVTYRKDSKQSFTRTGWVLDWGSFDWDDIGMALREFISNAIDRTLEGYDAREEEGFQIVIRHGSKMPKPTDVVEIHLVSSVERYTLSELRESFYLETSKTT